MWATCLFVVEIYHCHFFSFLFKVNYKSDLNWIRGVGWTPPGSHKAELARRAAELGLADGVSADEAIAKYQQHMMVSSSWNGDTSD